MRTPVLAVPLLSACLAVAGCSGGSSPVAGPSTPAPTTAARHLTPAVGKPIVILDGLVNSGAPLALDLASLAALPVRTLAAHEPFLKKQVTFTGVLFADLLDASRSTGSTVLVHALDDYQQELAIAVVRAPGVLLATTADGAPIDIKSGGPIRLVFPASSVAGKNADLWVWSIDRISVR